jgi:hypothetical protein
MPPTHTLEGLDSARTIRAEHGASVGIVLLSQYIEAGRAADILADGAAGIGYLLKDRILDPADLADAAGSGAGAPPSTPPSSTSCYTGVAPATRCPH